jgi:hypothetical protein
MSDAPSTRSARPISPVSPGATEQPAHIPVTPSFPELSLHVSPFEDPVLAQLGFDPRSPYVEQFWLSILGPSAVLFLRRVATRLEAEPEGFELDLVEWAQELGLGSKGGKHSPMWRTLDRICRFGLASRNGPNVAFRRHLPPLTSRQIERLPTHLQRAHEDTGNRAA